MSLTKRGPAWSSTTSRNTGAPASRAKTCSGNEPGQVFHADCSPACTARHQDVLRFESTDETSPSAFCTHWSVDGFIEDPAPLRDLAKKEVFFNDALIEL